MPSESNPPKPLARNKRPDPTDRTPYEILFRASPFGMFVLDSAGRVLDCNDTFLVMAGVERDKLIGCEIIRRSEDATLIPYIRRAMAGERVEFETRCSAATGRKASAYRYIFQPLAAADGQSMIAYVEDISRRKASETALAEAKVELEARVAERTGELAATEKRYRALVEQSLAGVYVIQGGKIVYANPMMCTIFGYPEGQLVGLGTHQLVAPEDRPTVAANVRRRLSGERQEMRYTFTGLRRDGQRIDVEVHGSIAEFDGKPAVIGVLLDITERRKLEQMLEHLAYFDPLTELPNRKMFYDRLDVLTAVARRADSRLAVLFIDIDRFKNVNDQHGHRVGDQVLIRVAEVLTATVRLSDTVARLGGDEFALILTQLTQLEDIRRIAQQVVNSVAAITLDDGTNAGIGASIGIALFPDDGSESESLLHLADKAMYEVKKSGRCAYRFAPR